ncbi:hypothetical protein PINS_up004188, partial [Pythium insidiosum]
MSRARSLLRPCPSRVTVTTECANELGITLEMCVIRPLPTGGCEVDLDCQLNEVREFWCFDAGIEHIASLPSMIEGL